MTQPISFEVAEILFKKHRVLFHNIGEVVMWLYEKHGIWIYLVPSEDNKNVFKPFFRGKSIVDQHLTKFYRSPTKAYEAGIEYSLNNLI